MKDDSPFHAILTMVADGAELDRSAAQRAFTLLMEGGVTPTQMAAFLMALRVRTESVEEITGAALAMRAKANGVQAPSDAVDTCGTGGDGTGTLNISTAVALVVAGCGVPVAKHGNRAVSSKAGSSDVLGALGINIDASTQAVERSIREAGVGFLMAPNHHPAMRHVAPVRAELGLRTLFNILGPLCNPAGVRRQVIGVYARRWLKPLAQVLRELGSEHVWLVHGGDGMDELTLTDESHVAELKNGTVRAFSVAPEDVGLPRAALADLAGGDAEANAQRIRELLGGEPGPFRNIVLLNSAAVLIVSGRTANLQEGIAAAGRSIDTGAAQTALDRLIACTQEST